MNVEQIMKLVDAYASEACNHGLYGGIHWHKQQIAARAVVVAAIKQLTKDAERYRVGREAEYVGLMPTFRAGRTWADAMDSAYDAAIAAQKEQV